MEHVRKARLAPYDKLPAGLYNTCMLYDTYSRALEYIYKRYSPRRAAAACREHLLNLSHRLLPEISTDSECVFGQVASEDDFRVEHVRKARIAFHDKYRGYSKLRTRTTPRVPLCS